eukprot:SAG22_NODE_408_length_10942_cov_6.157429_5_plen_237_part_00
MLRGIDRHWRAYKSLYRYITVVSILKIQFYTFYSLCTHFQRSLFRFRIALINHNGSSREWAATAAVTVMEKLSSKKPTTIKNYMNAIIVVLSAVKADTELIDPSLPARTYNLDSSSGATTAIAAVSARSTFFLDPLGRSEAVERCGGGSVPPVKIRAVRRAPTIAPSRRARRGLQKSALGRTKDRSRTTKNPVKAGHKGAGHRARAAARVGEPVRPPQPASVMAAIDAIGLLLMGR